MSIENAVVIGKDGTVIHWHTPEGRTAGHIPDTTELWDVIWKNRDRIRGIAHSHPGRGVPGPSHEDITTFSAIEAALGDRLEWWITSENRAVVLTHCGPGSYDYDSAPVREGTFWWMARLREMSYKWIELEPAEPPLPCGCDKRWGSYPKAAWEEDSHALIAYGSHGGLVLDHVGPHIDFELCEGAGPSVEDMGLTPPDEDPGLWIWSGKIVDTSYNTVDGYEYDYELSGQWRKLTEEEWALFRKGEPVLPESKHAPCWEQACEERQRIESVQKENQDA